MSTTLLPDLLHSSGQDFGKESLGDLLVAMDATKKVREAQLATARRAVTYALQAPKLLRAMWKSLTADSTPERIAELHTNREMIRAAFEQWVEIVKMTIRIMPKAEELAGASLEGSDRLREALEHIERFAAVIFSQWTSPEGLMEAIVETFELPEWLRTGPIPSQLQPPQSWYEETGNPFIPE